MAYRGTSNFKQDELTSVRRLRESMESPVEKGGGHKPVAKLYKAHGKIHFKLGGKIFAIDGGNIVLDPDMPAAGAMEGGPGSGPRKGGGAGRERVRQSVGSSASRLSSLAEKLHEKAGGRSSIGTTVNKLAGQLENIHYRDSADDKERIGNIATKLSDLSEKLHEKSTSGHSEIGASLNKIAQQVENSYHGWGKGKSKR